MLKEHRKASKKSYLLLKVTFDFDKFSREVPTKTTSMMVESSMNVLHYLAFSDISRQEPLHKGLDTAWVRNFLSELSKTQ